MPRYASHLFWLIFLCHTRWTDKENEIDHLYFSKELSKSIPKSQCSGAVAFIFLAKGMELVYVFVDKKGEQITSIPINEEICQGLTFNLDKIKKQIKWQ